MNSTPPQSEQQRLLAIETSTVACSVAIQIDGPNDIRIDGIKQEIPRTHNQALLGMVNDLLVRNETPVSELSGICFGRGPGSFTGTRIAAAVTQGLALAFGTQIYAVSSLYALAAGAFSEHPECCGVISFIRSRPGEYYRGVYGVRDGELEAVAEEEICQVNDLYPGSQEMRSAMNFFGEKRSPQSEWLVVFDELPAQPIENSEPSTVLVSRPDAKGLLAVPRKAHQLVSIADAVPVYVQGSKPWKKQSA